MHKYIFLLLLLSIHTIKLSAQTNEYTTVDTVEKVEEIVAPPPPPPPSTTEGYNDDINTETYAPTEEKHIQMQGWGEDVLGDTAINFRPFQLQEDTINAFRKNKKYEWINTLESKLHQLQKKQNETPPELPTKDYDSSPSALDNFFNSSFLKIFLWFIAGGFVLFIIYHLFLSQGVFSRASKRAVNMQEEDEIIEHLDNDFDKLYAKAFADGDTRLAMRFLFLKTLQKLNEKEYIKFAVDKTNSMYTKEMPAAIRNKFAQIALYYEYSWYGNAIIPANAFENIKNTVNTFTNNL